MCDPIKNLLISYLIYIYVAISDCYDLKVENSPCQALIFHGTCEKVKKCPLALQALQTKGQHELTRCGFDGRHEVVCCPDLTDRKQVKETTAGDQFINSGDGSNMKSSTKVSSGSVKIKRKCEKMCHKVYTDYRITFHNNEYVTFGERATLGQFPHAAAIGFENDFKKIEWKCGASLISTRFLLTTAHCFICYGCTKPRKARMGVLDITNSESSQDIDIKSYTPHPDYSPTTKHNDIGIIELVKDALITNIVYPACLYTKVDDPKGLHTIGWGLTVSNDGNTNARFLQYAGVSSLAVEQCNQTIVSRNMFSFQVILQTQICGTTTSDACIEDLGNPLQIEKEEGGYEIVGVASYGLQCGIAGPGIYTRVATYLDWIEQIVWPE